MARRNSEVKDQLALEYAAEAVNAYLAGSRGARPLVTTACEGCGVIRDTPLPEPTDAVTADTVPQDLQLVDGKLLGGDHLASTCHVCAQKELKAVREQLASARARLESTLKEEQASLVRAERTFLASQAERKKWEAADALMAEATKALAALERDRAEMAALKRPVGEFRDRLAYEEASSIKRVKAAEDGLRARQKAVEEAEAKPKIAARLIEDLRLEYSAARRQTRAAKTRLESVKAGKRILEPEV